MCQAGEAVDVELLRNRLREAGDHEAIGGDAYLAEVMQSVPVAAHAAHYAQIVREKSQLRATIVAGTELLRGGPERAGDQRRSRPTGPGRV